MSVYSCHVLLKAPFVPYSTGFCKQSCIFLLKSCKSMYQIKQIQTQIIHVGLHQDRNTLNKLMSFCTDPSFGNLRYAERIFNYIHEPSLFVFNVMIKGFAKAGSFRKALSLFGRLREYGLWPDNFTYPFVLKAIGCMGDVGEGGKVHGVVLKSGLQFDTYVCNSLMDMYAELGKVENSYHLLENMIEKDRVSWNVMISGYVKCKRFEDAISLYRQMRQESSEKPDEATVVSTLSACIALKDLELGKEIHNYIRDELDLTTVIGNALVDMYCKCGCVSVARQVFDEMPTKNVNCWTSMVSGYVKGGQLDKARELFERSPVRDVVLWTAMINGYVQFNRSDEAVALFKEMQVRRIKPDKFIVVVLLTGCAQLGALEQGEWIHGYIDENRIRVDTVVGTALIEMYAKCGCIEKSLKIFYGLKEKDTACWTSIICGLAINGKTSKALQLFAEMRQVGLRPDDITFIGVLSACSHGGLVEEGRRFFHSMTETYQIKPKVEHYGCLMDLLGRAGLLDEAEELVKKIPDEKNELLFPIYGALLSACRIHGNVDMGERLAMQLEKIRSSDSSVHTLISNMYASSNRWEDVTTVRRKMKDLGVKKVPGCSAIEIGGIFHEFLVGDPTHPKMREIHSILNTIAKPLLGSEENEMGREICDVMNLL